MPDYESSLTMLARLLALAWGACIGSFLNVVVHRLPKEQSLVKPRSRCPKCAKPIAWFDNVPVLSWLLLRGRCRHCRKRISARYPIVEAATAALALGLFERWRPDLAWAAAAFVAAAALLAVALIDADTFLIPDELSLGLVVVGLLVSPLNPYMRSADAAWWWAVWYSAKGAGIGFLMCLGVAEAGEKLFGKEAMGGGDVKLLAGVGAWTGGLGAFDCLMIGSLIGSVYGLALMVAGKLKRSEPIPFGPFLALGAVFNLFRLLPLGFPFSSF